MQNESELQLRQHVIMTQYLAGMIQTNSKISMGIILGNPLQISFQLLKLKQEAETFIEAIKKLEADWKIHKLGEMKEKTA